MSGRILVIDDVATNRDLLRAKLGTAYYDVLVAENEDEALELARRQQPSIVLIDVMMQTIDGFAVCKTLKADPATAQIPVVMVTAIDDPEDRTRGLDAGADDFLVKPISDLALFARVRNLMRMGFAIEELQLRSEAAQELGLTTNFAPTEPTPAQSVLIAAPDEATGARWGEALHERLSVGASWETESRAIEAAIAQDVPDAIVVHQQLGDGRDGLKLLADIARAMATRHCALLFVVDDDDMRTAAKALDLGAWDYLMAPYDPFELAVRMRSQLRRKIYSDKLRTDVQDGLRMATRDPLTGLYNRRYAQHQLRIMMERAREEAADFALMILDLDFFKQINDVHGHDAGDEVLAQIARRLQENVRGVDLAVRLGGEEFCLALPGTSQDDAREAAERIRRAVCGEMFLMRDGTQIECTVSIGIAVAPAGEGDVDSLLRSADRALYRSKADGRDRVSTAWDSCEKA
ncbi:PleD family two-component system response regulator [Pontivivens ytuae]|uniref:diguanylate cyclase n=1 Tax=Pontivivens ytuae TaxID=2789856 RepID=A0A7S9LQD1_9RHOB|nr:PleD family two-component system response regulator [Pontivivens ytuae]QPH53371.1 PleD family two-component system response regulator [Pontivivens ytuae]